MKITSISNDLVKMASGLHHKKGRLEQNLYLAEGIHLVQEAYKSGAHIRKIFWSERLLATDEGRELLRTLQERFEEVAVGDAVFEKIAETENPQGIVATIELPKDQAPDWNRIHLGLIIDGLQDPGNLGTIIRTAWAAGLDGLFLTSETADPYQGKAVRASMGGIFRQSIYRNFEPEWLIHHARQAGIQIIAADPQAGMELFQCDLQIPTLFIVGNEGRGLNPVWEDFSLKRLKIPQRGKAESLNVAVATGILIYEALRQRLVMASCKK